MAEQTPPTSLDHEARQGFDFERPPSTPRWVKAFGLAFLVLLLAIAVMVIHGIVTGQGPFQHDGLTNH